MLTFPSRSFLITKRSFFNLNGGHVGTLHPESCSGTWLSPESAAVISRTYSLRASRSTLRVRPSWPLADRLKAPSSFPPLSM